MSLTVNKSLSLSKQPISFLHVKKKGILLKIILINTTNIQL